SHQLDPEAMIFASGIAEENWRAAVGRDQHVRVAIIVDVSEGSATPKPGRAEVGAKLSSYLLKFSSTGIVKKVRRLAVLDSLLDFFNIVFNMPIGDKDVRPSIEVKIEEKA